ncbi:hypothetical protein MMC22_002338 [Lobaria immixta]|nr:hypothetical protein [Lobaria immixta]
MRFKLPLPTKNSSELGSHSPTAYLEHEDVLNLLRRGAADDLIPVNLKRICRDLVSAPAGILV